MLWTLIPAKSFHQSKRRLAAVLDADQRAALSAALLTRTLRVARAALPTGPLLVVAAGEDVASVALAAGVDRVVSPAAEGLNPQLAEAAAQVPQGDSLLILHADLPLLGPDDLSALAASTAPVVIAPDHRGQGTNALLQRTADRFFAFGEGSCPRHQAEAAARGLPATLLPRPGLARDLDEAEDWEAVLVALGLGSHGSTRESPLPFAALIARLHRPF